MINIEETSLIENETCKFYLPCGMCEFTKKQCTKLIAPERINYIPTWDTTPVKTYKDWRVGDWPKDLASNPDTFRVHFEDQPRYSDTYTSTSKYNPNITAEANNFNLNGVKQKLTDGK